METFKNWSQRKRSQMSHSSLQTGLGRPYSVDRLMFFRLSQNYVPRSCHRCWRRDLLETSEPLQSYVPSYNTSQLQKWKCRRKSTDLKAIDACPQRHKVLQRCWVVPSEIGYRNHTRVRTSAESKLILQLYSTVNLLIAAILFSSQFDM